MIPRAIVVFMIVALESAAFAAPSAEELFHQGQTFFDKGDYASAVAKWNESYRLSKEPELLFMIGQAFENDGRCANAVATYRRFVSLAPDSEHRPLAEKFVRELTPKCDLGKAPQEAHPSDKLALGEQLPDDQRETHSVRVKKITGLAVAGAGLVSVATGLVFGRRAVSLGDEVMNDCSSAMMPCQWSDEKVKQSDGQRDATIGKVLDVVGVAAIAAGVGLYIYAARDGDHALTIQPNAAGATMSWSGRW